MKNKKTTNAGISDKSSSGTWYTLKNSELKDYVAPVLGTILIFIIGQIVAPGFGTPKSIFNFLATSSVLMIACLPQVLAIVSGKGGIDLSLGALMSLSVAWGGALSGGTISGLITSMLIMAGVGVLCGLCNGFAVQYWGVPAMVVTLSVGNLLDNCYLAITKGKPIGSVTPELLEFGTSNAFGYVRWVLLLAITVVIIVELLLRHTKYGKMLYLFGTNWKAAEMTGIKAKQLGVLTYVFAAVVSSLAGFLLLSIIGSTQSGAGNEYTMLAVAAAVIGGVNIAGGKGTYVGAALGAVLIMVLNGFLIVVQMPEGARDLIKGLVLLGILVAYARAPKMRQ